MLITSYYLNLCLAETDNSCLVIKIERNEMEVFVLPPARTASRDIRLWDEPNYSEPSRK